MEGNRELATSFNNFGSIVDLIAYCKPLVGNGLHSGTAEQLASKVIFAYGLGISPDKVFTIAKNLQIIQDTIGCNAALQQGLIDRAKIRHQTIEDFAPVYNYITDLENGVTLSHDEVTNNTKILVYYTPETLNSNKAKNIAEGYIPVLRNRLPSDFRTKIKFTRVVNGVEVIEYGTYSFNDAVLAGLSVKDNWKKMPKLMCYARAFSIGSKRIANDVLNGMCLIEELDPNIKYNEEYTEHEVL